MSLLHNSGLYRAEICRQTDSGDNDNKPDRHESIHLLRCRWLTALWANGEETIETKAAVSTYGVPSGRFPRGSLISEHIITTGRTVAYLS